MGKTVDNLQTVTGVQVRERVVCVNVTSTNSSHLATCLVEYPTLPLALVAHTHVTWKTAQIKIVGSTPALATRVVSAIFPSTHRALSTWCGVR